jgi:hypothetical protein
MQLVDDDGDGVPDRGVIEVPEGTLTGWGFGRGWRFEPTRGTVFGRYRGWGHHGSFGRFSGPFRIVGGLACLAFLAPLVGLGAVLYHRRRVSTKAEAASEAEGESSGLE